MIRPVIGMLSATALGSALLANGAAADPWMRRGPAAGRGPTMEAGGLRPRGGEGPAAPLGQGEANASGPVRPTAPSLTDPAFLARRDLGVTRAVEARGGPILIRLGPPRMTQVHFSSDIQHVVTAFTKPQDSLETAGAAEVQ